MKNVTITMEDTVLQRARIAAATEGKSLSKFIADTVAQKVGRPLTQKEALDRFLSGPLMRLTDENGKAPTRDQIYDDEDLR